MLVWIVTSPPQPAHGLRSPSLLLSHWFVMGDGGLSVFVPNTQGMTLRMRMLHSSREVTCIGDGETGAATQQRRRRWLVRRWQTQRPEAAVKGARRGREG